MDPGRTISEYCERLDLSFWAEPANAVSNIAFIATALGILWVLLWSGRRDRPALLLVALTAVIGVGSFLFHTMPSRLTALADVLPIAIFIHAYFFMAMVRFVRLRTGPALLATAAFALGSTLVAMALRPLLGTSAGYSPALIALFGVAALIAGRNARIAFGLAMAGLMFMLSLTFRILDQPVCSWFPIGTHFMWHVLNAVVIYMLLRLVLHAGKRQSCEH